MSASPPKTPPTSYPEYAVRRETISRYFHPPLPRSAFHDSVSKGKILPVNDPDELPLVVKLPAERPDASRKSVRLPLVPSVRVVALPAMRPLPSQ